MYVYLYVYVKICVYIYYNHTVCFSFWRATADISRLIHEFTDLLDTVNFHTKNCQTKNL